MAVTIQSFIGGHNMSKRNFNWNSMPVANRPTSLETRKRKSFTSGSFNFIFFDISEDTKPNQPPMPTKNPFIRRKTNG